MNHDRLLQLMIQRLQRRDLAKETQEEFLKEVVASYMAELMGQGFIPHHLMTALEEDLTEELLEMFRKKTYGSPTLPDYRDKAKGKEKRERKTKRAVPRSS